MAKPVTLAEALLRRKELQQLIDRIQPMRAEALFIRRTKRVKVEEGIDDVAVDVPVLRREQVDGEHNHYARQLRLIDGMIQQCNWTTQMPEEANSCFEDYKEPEDVQKIKEQTLARDAAETVRPPDHRVR